MYFRQRKILQQVGGLLLFLWLVLGGFPSEIRPGQCNLPLITSTGICHAAGSQAKDLLDPEKLEEPVPALNQELTLIETSISSNDNKLIKGFSTELEKKELSGLLQYYRERRLRQAVNTEVYSERCLEEELQYEERIRKLLQTSYSAETSQDIITTPRQLEVAAGTSNYDTVGIVGSAGGSGHTLVLKEDGSVWAWGDNNWGQLGQYSHQPNEYDSIPSKVCGWWTGYYYDNSSVKMVATGEVASYAVKNDGTVWAWGDNFFNHLGVYQDVFNSQSKVSYAMRVPGIYSAVFIAAGRFHQVALDYYGSVYTWGSNDDGQLGTGAEWYEESSSPVKLASITDIIAVSAGESHCLALQSDGTVWAWGQNTCGQIGDGARGPSNDRYTPVKVPGLPKIKAIAANGDHSLALAEDGRVYAWGHNWYGVLGDGSCDDRSSPVEVQGLNDVIALASGTYFSMALSSDGSVWCWGGNYSGQLGNGGMVNSYIPVKVSGLDEITSISAGGSHAMAIRKDGTLWVWGANNHGQLGNSVSWARSQPAEVSALSQVKTIHYELCNGYTAIKQDGSVYTWGSGQANIESEDVPEGVKDIRGGSSLTVILKNDGSVWTKGYNYYGQLGVDTSTRYSDNYLQVPINDVRAIGAGRNFVIALKNDGTLWSWGNNNTSQLGYETDAEFSSAPCQIPGLVGVASIDVKYDSTVATAIKNDGTVWSWGSSSYSDFEPPQQEEGLLDVVDRYGDLCLKKDGTVWTKGSNCYGQLGTGSWEPSYSSDWVQVPQLSGIKAIAYGLNYYNLALDADGKVWAWGYNSDGQIGNGSNSYWDYCYAPVQVKGLPEITAIEAGYYSSLALSSDGSIYTWGSNCLGELGDGAVLCKNTPFMSQVYTLPPSAAFSYTPLAPTTNTIMSFDASASTATNSSIISYAWDFGDRSSASGKKVQHLYENAGTFTVTLTVTNEKGKTASLSKTIDVTYVPPVTPESIKLNRNTLSLQAGMGKASLTATLTPENADHHISWTSDKESIVKVENGVVTPLAEGIAVITATTINNLCDTCVVTVNPPPTDLPLIKNVQMYIDNNRLPDSGLVFLDGVDLEVKFKPDVDWRGKEPGHFEFITPGGKFTSEQEISFNVGKDFGAGAEMEVYSVDAAGKRSPLYIGKFSVASDPFSGAVEWRYGTSFCAGNANIKYTGVNNFALGIIEQNLEGDIFPADVPFFGKNDVEIKLYPNFNVEFDLSDNKGQLVLANLNESGSSDKESKLNLAGILFNTAKREVSLDINAGLEFHFNVDKRRWSYGGNVTAGIEGYAQTPTVTWYIAVPAFPSPVPVNGRMGLGVKYEVSETLNDIIPAGTKISSLVPYLSGEANLNPYGKVIGGVGIADKIEGQLIGQLGLEGCWGTEDQPLWGVLPSELNINGSIAAALILFKFQLETPVYEYEHQIYGAKEGLLAESPGFKLITRDYIRYGNSAFINRNVEQSVKYNAFNQSATWEEPIKTNTYPYSQPSIVSTDDAQYLFWIDEDLQRDPGLEESPNSTELVFSVVRNNTRSAPLPVADDGTADFGVQAQAMPDGRIMVVWENVAGKLPADASVNDMLAAMDIAYGVYNPDDEQWQTGSIINDTSLDCSPKLSIGADGSGMLCWTKNNNNNIWGDGQHPDRIMYSIWDGNAWSNPETVETGANTCIVHSALCCDNQKTWLLWESDGDSDLTTLNDREIEGISFDKAQGWGTNYKLTDNSQADQNPEMIFDGQQIKVFWLQDNNLMMSKGINLLYPETIVDSSRTSNDTSFIAINNSTECSLIWSGPSPEGNDIYLTHWDNDNDLWGEPLQITHSESLERNIAGAYIGTDQFMLIYDKQEIRDNADGLLVSGQTDLYLLKHKDSTDLEVQDIILDSKYLQAGQDVNITAIIKNDAETIPAAYVVAFFNGDPDNSGVLIATTPSSELIAPGSTRGISCTWTLPSSENLSVFAQVYLPSGWTDDYLENNILSKNITVKVPAEQSDLALAYLVSSNYFPQPGEEVNIYTQVSNLGDICIASGVPVKLYLGDPNNGGELLSTQSTGSSLGPSEACDLVFNWTASGNGPKYLYAMIEVPVSIADERTSNNQLCTTIDVSLEIDYEPPAYLGASIDSLNTTIVLAFNKDLYNNLSSLAELKEAVQFAPDEITYRALDENDTISINGPTLFISFAQPITGKTNKIKIAGNSLKSANGNVLEDTIETGCITANELTFIGLSVGTRLGMADDGAPSRNNCVNIPFKLAPSENNASITGYAFDVCYDPSKVTPTGIVAYTDNNKNGIAVPPALGEISTVDSVNAKVYASWSGTLAATPAVGSDVLLFKIIFDIQPGFTSADAQTSISVINPFFSLTSGTTTNVTVSNGAVIYGLPGDVSGDGNVNNTDCIMMARKILRGDDYSFIKAEAADLNGDGVFNNTDRIHMLRRILRGSTYLFPVEE